MGVAARLSAWQAIASGQAVGTALAGWLPASSDVTAAATPVSSTAHPNKTTIQPRARNERTVLI